jgi:hypothetical protein
MHGRGGRPNAPPPGAPPRATPTGCARAASRHDVRKAPTGPRPGRLPVDRHPPARAPTGLVLAQGWLAVITPRSRFCSSTIRSTSARSCRAS